MISAVVTQGRDLVKWTGRVEYTVVFTSGTSSVPPNSQLVVATSGGITALGTRCASSAWSMQPDHVIPENMLAAKSVAGGAQLNWNCTFEVEVSQNQQATGQLPPFDIQLSYVPNSPAWFIPKVTTLPVPVWSGATLTHTQWDVVQTANQYYHGE